MTDMRRPVPLAEGAANTKKKRHEDAAHLCHQWRKCAVDVNNGPQSQPGLVRRPVYDGSKRHKAGGQSRLGRHLRVLEA